MDIFRTIGADPYGAGASSLDRRSVISLRILAILAVTIAATLAYAEDWSSPVRVVLVLAFLLFAPGLALAELLEMGDPIQRLALATAASLSMETIVAVVVLYAGLFSERLVFTIVIALTIAACVFAVVRAARAPAIAGPERGRLPA